MGRYTGRRTGIGAVVVAGAVTVGLVPTGVSAATSTAATSTAAPAATTTAAQAVAARARAATTTVADLRADVDGDGAVDVTGAKDEVAENTWAPARGAIFLATWTMIRSAARRRTPPAGQSDGWVQDWFEPAYMTMPGPAGEPVGLRLMLRSPQNHLEKDPDTGVNDSRGAGKQLYLQLRGPGVDVVEVPTALDQKGDDYSLSSMGNLERIPPYRATEVAGGKRYSTGRVVMGVRSDGSKPSAGC